MTAPRILPLPESAYQLVRDAARTWPDSVATQWIPDLADYTRRITWTYAELAGTVTRIANALTALGVRRPDAVTLCGPNTSMLYAATLAAQAAGIAAPVNPALSGEHIAALIRRARSRVIVTAGPELNERLWQRILPVARQTGVTAVLALRPDGAHGAPPALPAGDAPAAAVMNHDPERLPQGDTEHGGLVVAYLDDVIAGQPPDRLAWADPPAASDLAAFVHTGGTTGAPKIAAQVPVDADISSLRLPIVGASPLPATVREAFATHTGRRLLEGYGLTEATCAWPSAGPRCSRATSATRTPAARG